jgi:hypothetical protein
VRRDVERDQAWAREAFKRLVWPGIAPLIGGGEFISSEEPQAAPMLQSLDRDSGIDGFQKLPEGGYRSVAHRVQKVDRSFDTFTLRERRQSGEETEVQKRVRALEDEWGKTRPDLQIQGYVSKDISRALTAAAVRGDDLWSYVTAELHRLKRKTNPDDGVVFIVAPWRALFERGAKIKVWRAPLRPEEAERIACEMAGIDPDEFRQPSDEWALRTVAAKGCSLVPSASGAWILHGALSLRESLTLNKWISCRSDAAVEWKNAQKAQQRWRDLVERRDGVQDRVGRPLDPAQSLPLATDLPEAAE